VEAGVVRSVNFRKILQACGEKTKKQIAQAEKRLSQGGILKKKRKIVRQGDGASAIQIGGARGNKADSTKTPTGARWGEKFMG